MAVRGDGRTIQIPHTLKLRLSAHSLEHHEPFWSIVKRALDFEDAVRGGMFGGAWCYVCSPLAKLADYDETIRHLREEHPHLVREIAPLRSP
jgi:hypothetical protein